MRLLALLLVLLVFRVDAASHYIRSAASGAANGNDWTDAWTDLPATFTSGDTYYVADGTYGVHVFGTAVSGTNLITIKKATANNHGTATGWSDSYSVTQALFTASSGNSTAQYNHFRR